VRYIKILSVMLFAFTSICSIALASEPVLLDKIVAIVNKEAITWSDIYKAMEFEFSESHRNLSGDEKKQLFKKNELIFLESFIDMRLQLQEAQRIGIFISPDEIESAIKSLKEKYSMTDDMFIITLKKEGFTLDEYKKKLQEKITVGRLIDQEIRSRIVIDDESISRYISQNKELISQYDGYNLSYIFIKKSNNRSSDEEKARNIFNKLKAGEDFAQTAMKYSEDATARSGGAIGLINKADLSEEFSLVLSKMKAGDISEPFWSANGIHILRLNAIVTTDKSRQINEQIRQKLAEEKFMKVYKNWLKALRERAYIQILVQQH